MIGRFEQFTSAVAGISRCVQKIERTEMAKFGLKGPQTQCMVALSHYPEGITSGTLREVCNKDKAAISRTIASRAWWSGSAPGAITIGRCCG